MPRLTGQIKGTEESAAAAKTIDMKSVITTKPAKAKKAAAKKAEPKKKAPKSKPVVRKVIGEKKSRNVKAVAEATVPPDNRHELVVFAFRLTEPERNKIHNAAGRGKATSFARAALVAVATGDETAVKELMASAAKNLKAL